MSHAEPDSSAAAPFRATAWSGATLPLVFFALVAVLRVPVALAHQDTWYPFEVHTGTIARALLDGVDLDIARLPIVSHARGCVLFGVLLTPFYALLGTSAIVMKLLPLVWHAVTIALLVRLVDREHSRKAAVACGLVFAFAPPMLQKLSVVGLASHLESMLFFLVAIFALRALVTRPGPGRALVLGLVIGAAGFFHLQALLPCLLVGALALPSLRAAYGAAGNPAIAESAGVGSAGAARSARGALRAIGALVLGTAIGAAPSFLFDGGNLGMLRESLNAKHGDQSASAETKRGSRSVDIANPPPFEKLRDLVTHDYAYALEYRDLGEPLGPYVGGGVALVCIALALIALAHDRSRIRAFLARCLGASSAMPPLSLVFALHAIGVVAFYLVSHAHHQEEISAGLTNRHLAPVFFSSLVLAALGIGALAQSSRQAFALVFLLIAPGAAALPRIGTPNAATLMPHRGECYEWFLGQLDPAISTRPEAALAHIARVDRGDPAFHEWRFRIVFSSPPATDATSLAREIADLAKLPLRIRSHAAFESARRIAGRPGFVIDPPMQSAMRTVPRELVASFFRGIGIGTEPPRLVDPNASQEGFQKRVLRILRVASPDEANWICEGFGFQLGVVFDPYNANQRARMEDSGWLPDAQRPAFHRGIAWGARQRYIEPPHEVPAGLVLFELVPEALRGPFSTAFTGLRLPD